jgi:hypothetical protein
MSAQSLTTRLIPVHILTLSYRILGEVRVTNTGLNGVLTDSRSAFMQVTNASVARLHQPDKLVKEMKEIRLVKAQIHSASLKRRQDLGPKPISRPGYSHVNHFRVEMTDAAFEYEGIFEWPGRFDFTAVISGGSWEFLPIYEGMARSIEIPEFTVPSPAMLVNRNHIATFSHTLYKENQTPNNSGLY